MRFYDKPVEVSVTDSDGKPESWKPPEPVMLQGPPPRATWESAAKDAIKALTKVQSALSAQKAQTDLAVDERDQARRDLASAQADLVAANKALAECIAGSGSAVLEDRLRRIKAITEESA